MYGTIAVYQELFLYVSLSVLALAVGLGIIAVLIPRRYQFSIGNADVFVDTAILEVYVEHYLHKTFSVQKPKVKICVNRRNQITITFDLLKQADSSQDFEQIKKDLSTLFSFCLNYNNPLFLEIAYK